MFVVVLLRFFVTSCYCQLSSIIHPIHVKATKENGDNGGDDDNGDGDDDDGDDNDNEGEHNGSDGGDGGGDGADEWERRSYCEHRFFGRCY